MPVAEINGIEINYVVEGAGEPLVLVHNLIAVALAKQLAGIADR